jgi:hypothetical protein
MEQLKQKLLADVGSDASEIQALNRSIAEFNEQYPE